jgi:AraC-like DNA-binding protein
MGKSTVTRSPQALEGFADRTPLPATLVRALEWLRDQLDGPVDCDTLAAVAGVKPRTLHAQFRRFLRTTPLGWVRKERLARAHRMLLDPDGASSVSEAALSSGLTELGRFASDYRRQFGELPSQTLRHRRIKRFQNGTEFFDDEALLLTWRAFPAAFAIAPAECAAALEDLERAQDLAPTFGLSKALAAWCWAQRGAQHFGSSPGGDLARACELAAAAQVLAPNDPSTLCLAAGALTLAHRLDEAGQLIDRAIARDPWFPLARVRRGWHAAYLGDGEGAIGDLTMALQLAPFEPLRHISFIGMGCAHFATGRFEQAARWTQAALDAYPQSFWAERILIASLVHVGASTSARRATRQLLRKDPDLTIIEAMRAWPFQAPFMVRLAEGLEAAGIPRS